MFTFNKKDGGYRQYKARNVQAGTASNGTAFTRFQISNKLQDGTYENAMIFVYETLSIKDGDLIEITKINSLENRLADKNGEKVLYTTIFADVKPVSPTVDNTVEIIGTILDDDDPSRLPF